MTVTGKWIELPLAAFTHGTIQGFVNDISEPYPFSEDPESAMRSGGQETAMRKRATARG